MCTRFLIDSDGAHKVITPEEEIRKQLDDGIDHTFVLARGSETVCSSFLFLSFIAFDVYYVVDSCTAKPIPKYNGHAPTGWLILL